MEDPAKVLNNSMNRWPNASKNKLQIIRCLLEDGVNKQKEGQSEVARRYYQDVLKMVPDQPDALNLLGVLENEKGHLNQAIKLLSRAIQIAPSQACFYSNLGNAFRSAGKSPQAISCYRKSMSLSPDFFEAYYNLAILYRENGQLKDAKAILREALVKQPMKSEAWYLLADTLRREKDTDESLSCYEKVLSINPKHENAWFHAGNGHGLKQDFQKAERCYRHALQINSRFAECWNNLGLVCYKTGNLTEAMDCYDKAIQVQPDFDEAHSNLGNVLYKLGQKERAVSNYLKALECKPDAHGPMVGMGRFCQEDGVAEQALQWYQKAFVQKPDSWEIIEQIGNVKRMLGNIEASFECYEKALRINPNAPSVYISRGNAYRKIEKIDDAVSNFQKALDVDPKSLTALNNMAIALTDIGKSEEAISTYERMLEIHDEFSIRIKQAMTLPVIYPSTDAMRNCRRKFSSQLESLLETGMQIDDPYHQIGISNFMLALHGFNERPIRELIAKFYLSICPQLAWTSPKLKKYKGDQKIRLGLVSRFLHDHTIGRLYSGIIEKLDKDRFDVLVFRFDHHDDDVVRSIDQNAKETIFLPQDIFKARERVADAELDILFYPEIGMDPLVYFMGFSRLAPVQCKRGFPITMGIPAIDYYISSEAAEPEEAQQYYTEKLICLKGTGYYYHRPKRPDTEPTRAMFGLPEDRTLYVCSQSLFKLHPDFDFFLEALLEKDPEAVLVLLEGVNPFWKTLLIERFEKRVPNIIDRIQFVPRQPRDRFMSLHLVADAVIDTIYFSGGNTSLECFAWGIPVATWPSPLLPGRLTYGFYKRMGIMDCVAWDKETYVEIAYRLAHDPTWRNEIGRKITEKSSIIFENKDDLKELEFFFKKAVNDAYNMDEIQ